MWANADSYLKPTLPFFTLGNDMQLLHQDVMCLYPTSLRARHTYATRCMANQLEARAASPKHVKSSFSKHGHSAAPTETCAPMLAQFANVGTCTSKH